MSWSGLPDTVRTVECAVADFTSVARGKVVARAVFGSLLPEAYGDLHLEPDLATAVPVPGRDDRVSVVCEPTGLKPDARRFSPRAALRRVIGRLADAGLRATVAPELEFFLVERMADGGLRPAGVPDHPARGNMRWGSPRWSGPHYLADATMARVRAGAERVFTLDEVEQDLGLAD